MRPHNRPLTEFTTLTDPLVIHTTAYSHVVLVTVGPSSSDDKAEVIYAAVLAHFRRLGVAHKASKPPRWTVSRPQHDAAAPTPELYHAIEQQRKALLRDHYNVRVFYAHDESGCPQCARATRLPGDITLYRHCLAGDINLLFRDGKTGLPY